MNSDIVSSRTGSHTVEKHAVDVTVMNGAFLKTKIIELAHEIHFGLKSN